MLKQKMRNELTPNSEKEKGDSETPVNSNGLEQSTGSSMIDPQGVSDSETTRSSSSEVTPSLIPPDIDSLVELRQTETDSPPDTDSIVETPPRNENMHIPTNIEFRSGNHPHPEATDDDTADLASLLIGLREKPTNDDTVDSANLLMAVKNVRK